jgi:hypothetical protein
VRLGHRSNPLRVGFMVDELCDFAGRNNQDSTVFVFVKFCNFTQDGKEPVSCFLAFWWDWVFHGSEVAAGFEWFFTDWAWVGVIFFHGFRSDSDCLREIDPCFIFRDFLAFCFDLYPTAFAAAFAARWVVSPDGVFFHSVMR